jgi:hypothetical protein
VAFVIESVIYHITAMRRDRLQLLGGDWARYFAPVAMCAYVAAICAALIITSRFLSNRHEGLTVTAAGLFGLLLSCALGAVLLFMQLRELRYLAVPTQSAVNASYQRVLALMRAQGWRLTTEQLDQRLEARTVGSVLDAGELVVVQFRPDEVLVASICDPSIGFSLVGQRRCRQHRELVQQALTG